MVWIDIVCCVIIAIFALLGLWHGLLKSIFKLVAWVAGLLGAYFATDVIGNFIATNLEIDGLTVKIICVCVGSWFPSCFSRSSGIFCTTSSRIPPSAA